jgi:hypothetical protein
VTGGEGEPEVEAIDFGFILARTMRFYGWTYWEALDQPIEAFWLLQQNIDRLQASDDLRRLENGIMAAHGTAESVRNYQQRLIREIGTVTVMTPKLERDKLLDLSRLGSMT